VALGVDGVEFDVRLSADGVPVVFHDPTVERTTDGAGAVDRLTLNQLQSLDAGYRFGPTTFPYRAKGVTIPTVSEALDATAPLPVIIEVKALEAAEPLLALVRERREEQRVTVGSFVARALVPFRLAGLPTSATFAEVRALLAPAVCRFRRRKLPFHMMSIPPEYRGMRLPLGALARCIAPAGAGLYIWTVNDPSEAQRLWRRGVCGILTDDPATILEARRALS
jgi:glycerophosphoryl diester phosphodiesterase